MAVFAHLPLEDILYQVKILGVFLGLIYESRKVNLLNIKQIRLEYQSSLRTKNQGFSATAENPFLS